MPRHPLELRLKRLETAILPKARHITIIHEQGSETIHMDGESYSLDYLTTWHAQGHSLVIREIPAGFFGTV